MSLLGKIKAGTNNTKSIKFPGTDKPVLLKILSNADTQEAGIAAERYFESQKIVFATSTIDLFADEQKTQMLFRALCDPDDRQKPIADSVAQFREQLTIEEKNYLIDQYTAFEQECSPTLDKMTDAEVDVFLGDLKKNPAPIMSCCNIVLLRRLLLSSVSRPAGLPTDSGYTLQ